MANDSMRELFQSLPLFKDLSTEEIDPILSLTNSQVYPRGAHIFMQDEPITTVYFIKSGSVKIYKTDIHGKEQIVNVLTKGDMFPHQGFFRQGNYPAHAEVAEHADIYSLPIKTFENFLVQNPSISIKLIHVLGELIIDLQKRLEQQILHNTYEQIIMLLLRLADRHGKKNSTGWITIDTAFSNQQLANMIGSSRETISRTLSKLKKQQIITKDSSGNLMLDKDKLNQLLFIDHY
ncbi:Crp/Fnr family transcriptional regulator [Paraliobacillus quinghaiensis]|uniref:Crp/Fnr family transcriptional regulator n=1 Tax=Paraliobacillus quinghaiensis TaxID=470815 RepID=A0A917TIU3_9BACI|nr:Crp/Fnr family transcriptional regulator [Paraliobacillus quinghaiensis]GGM25011.1 Crp/Fnr family transcriptional regulator [Paraliobacillus quinghaiensis]